jgi:MYXO-CTERM domain-containing protein
MQVNTMMDMVHAAPAARRTRAAAVLGVVGVLLLATAPASAAPIKRLPHATRPLRQSFDQELASLQKAVDAWKHGLGNSSTARFFQNLSLTNPNGTLKSHALARLLGLKSSPMSTAPAPAAPATSTVSSAPHSSAFMVLIPPTTADPGAVTVSVGGTGRVTATQVLSPEVTPVPEPSSVLSALGLIGLAGAWWRLQRRRPTHEPLTGFNGRE